jgi:hypothetical protein
MEGAIVLLLKVLTFEIFCGKKRFILNCFSARIVTA